MFPRPSRHAIPMGFSPKGNQIGIFFIFFSQNFSKKEIICQILFISPVNMSMLRKIFKRTSICSKALKSRISIKKKHLKCLLHIRDHRKYFSIEDYFRALYNTCKYILRYIIRDIFRFFWVSRNIIPIIWLLFPQLI